MEALLQFLSSIHPFSEPLVFHLSQVLKVKELRKKNFLLRAGHVSSIVCFIEKGLLRCFYEKGNAQVSSWFMKEGDVIFSIESFYHQSPSYESIQALEDCTLYYITYDELQFIYKNFAEFNFIGRVLTEKYHTLWAQQLYGLRMHQAGERYGWLLNNYPKLVLRVPAKHLASYLGIDETTLSKIKGGRKFVNPKPVI